MKNCIFNNKLTTIELHNDRIDLGSKTIKYSDVYAINKDSFTKYLTLFTKNLFTFIFLISNIILYLLMGYVSTLVLLLSFSISLAISYWLNNIYMSNLFSKEKFIIYDIIYETSHDTILVSKNDGIEIKSTNPKLRFLKYNQLQRYIKRITQGRKYLITQCEADISSGDELYEKYKTVSTIRYKDPKILSRATVGTIENVINNNFSTFRKYTRYLLRANVIMIIIIVFNFISFWNMNSIFTN